MNLYELTDNYVNLIEKLEDGEVDDDVIKDTLESIDEPFDEKIANYGKVINQLKADESNLADIIKHYNERKQRIANKIKYMKTNVEDSLNAVGKDKVETTDITVKMQLNAPKVVIDDEQSIPKEFIKEEPKVLKNDLKLALKSGQKINGAKLEQTKSIRIK